MGPISNLLIVAKSVIRADGFFHRPLSKWNDKKPKTDENGETLWTKAFIISCL
jgi:hypothetical protein